MDDDDDDDDDEDDDDARLATLSRITFARWRRACDVDERWDARTRANARSFERARERDDEGPGERARAMDDRERASDG